MSNVCKTCCDIAWNNNDPYCKTCLPSGIIPKGAKMDRKPFPPNAQNGSGQDIWTVYGERGPLKSFETEPEAYAYAQKMVGNGERVYL